MLEDVDPSYILSRIQDAKAYNASYRAQRDKLVQQLEELDRRFAPDISRLDAEHEDIMNRMDDLQNRSQELGELAFLQRELELLEQERDSDRFKRISVEPFVELGVLRPEDPLTMLPQRILELINHYQRLRLERHAAALGHDAARRRLLALREMRRRMGKELKRNRAALEEEVEEARDCVRKLGVPEED
jgi:hypothetical protein